MLLLPPQPPKKIFFCYFSVRFYHHHHHHHRLEPLLSQGLLQKLLPAVPIPWSIPPISPPNLLASSITPSSHLSFSLPLCLLPFTTATRTLLVGLCSSIRITCPAHFNPLILMYVTISLSLYNVYNSLLYFILHCHL